MTKMSARIVTPKQKIQSEEKLAWLYSIHEISRDVISTIGLNDCLKAILDKTVELLEVEMASIMLIDKTKNELTIRYAKGLSEKIIRQAKAMLSQKPPVEVAVWVVQKGEPLLIKDIGKDGRFLKRNGKKYSTNSLLSVPLKVKDEVIGVLNVNNKKDKSVFTSDDLELLMTLANEVSIAIQYNRIYEELTIANEKLKDLDQLKSDFVANVSHELSTPLATSRYLLSIIEKGMAGEIGKKQKDYVLMIENNIDRLTRLIDNLLNLSRLEAGRFELKRQPLDLVGVVKEALEPFKAQVHSRSVALKTALDSHLPQVYADKDRIIQVFVNLLDNAIKFSSQGGRITISAESLQKLPQSDLPLSFIKVCVSDTGCGIPQEDINKIFVKFQMVPQKFYADKIKGTGLGLAIAKEIIERHKGQIWVESEPDKGSKFFFTLPVYNEEFFFIEQLEEQIRKAQDTGEKVSFLIFALPARLRRTRSADDKQLKQWSDTIYNIVKESVRRPTDLVREIQSEGKIFVIAETDKAGGAILIERVLKDVGRHKFKGIKGNRLSLHTVVVTYPDDGNNRQQLMDKAVKKIRSRYG